MWSVVYRGWKNTVITDLEIEAAYWDPQEVVDSLV